MEQGFNSICAFCFTQKGFSNICPHCGYEERPMNAANHLPPRTILNNRFIIGALIGVGGFGLVYKAFDMQLNRIVAIKELFPPALVNRIPGTQEVIITSQRSVPQFNYMLERFLLEAKSLGRLGESPNVVTVYDRLQANNTAYIIMEYLDGHTLDTKGRLPAAQVVSIALEVLQGLELAHRNQILHRDLKPSNIFLCRSGQIKIIDFGAGKFDGLSDDPRMICAKVLTDGYAPPEQYRDDRTQGPYTDLYALGATMYCLLTGKVPPSSTDREKGARLLPPSREIRGIPGYLDRIILRAMSLDERLRIGSAKEFYSDLINQRMVRTEDEENRRRRRMRVASVFITLFILCAAAFGGWYYYEQLRNSVSADSMILEDERLRVAVCVDGDAPDSLPDMFGALESGFAEYAGSVTEHSLELSVEYVSEDQLDGLLSGGDDAPVLVCGGDGFVSPCRPDWLDNLLDDTYMFTPDDPEGFVTSFDIDVLYVNQKLLAETGMDIASLTSIEAISAAGQVYASGELFGGYEGFVEIPDAMERFCAGEIMFCAARASDCDELTGALPGYCQVMAIPGGQIRAGLTGRWHINGDADENQRHAAQLFLSYLAGDEAQDIMCLQNPFGIPANTTIYDLYGDFHPELADILDDREQFDFD